MMVIDYGLCFSITYIVQVDSFCIKNQCIGKTSFQALVDSGSSFTLLPQDVYKKITLEVIQVLLDLINMS